MTDKQRAERIHYHMYTTNEGIAEHTERIVALEELCGDLFDRLMDEDDICGECRSQCDYGAWNFGADGCIYKQRMDELGVPRGQ